LLSFVFIYLFIYLFVSLLILCFIYLLQVCLFICLFVYLFVCLVCLFVYLFICLVCSQVIYNPSIHPSIQPTQKKRNDQETPFDPHIAVSVRSQQSGCFRLFQAAEPAACQAVSGLVMLAQLSSAPSRCLRRHTVCAGSAAIRPSRLSLSQLYCAKLPVLRG
jgi:hypothetical protein